MSIDDKKLLKCIFFLNNNSSLDIILRIKNYVENGKIYIIYTESIGNQEDRFIQIGAMIANANAKERGKTLWD